MRAKIICCFCALGITLGAAVTAEPLAPSGPVALNDVAALDFLQAHRDLLQLLEVDPDDRSARLGLAELHLAHGMIVEGASLLAGLDARRMTPKQQSRYAILNVTAGLLASTGPDTEALAASKLWQSGAALRAHALWKEGQSTQLQDATLSSLDGLPKELRGIVLPSLLNIAIATKDWDRGAALAERFDAHPDLAKSSRYWLSLGRVAEARDQPVAAFEGYLHASRGEDAGAHAARVALIRLGLVTGSLTPELALSQLEIIRWAWRGDDNALDGLSLLAEVAEQQGDRVLALSALAQINRDYDDPTIRNSALNRGEDLIAAFYQSSETEDLSLSAFLNSHKRIAADWQFNPTFHASAGRLAETFLKRGMSSVAAREAAELRELISVSKDLGLADGDPLATLELTKLEARAYFVGGRYDAAIRVLNGLPNGQADDEAKQLLGQSLIQAGRPVGENASEDTVRPMAERAFASRDWEAAHDGYKQLSETETFAFPDAVRLMIAAHRLGRADTLSRLAEEIPRLTDLPAWHEMAATLANRPTGDEDPASLTREAAMTAVRRAGELRDATDQVRERAVQ